MILSSESVFVFVVVLNYAGGLLVNPEVRASTFRKEPLWVYDGKRSNGSFLYHPPSSMFRDHGYIHEAGMRSTRIHQDFSSNDDLQSTVKHNLISKRQIQVRNGYVITGMSYLMVCVRSLHLDFSQNGLHVRSIYNLLGGSFLITSLSFLLALATVADMKGTVADDEEFSLRSNTFKRFNWILIVYSLMCLSVAVINSQFTNPIFLVPPLVALWNALKGHLYGGVIGWIPNRHVCAMFTDMREGWFSTMSTIKCVKWKSWVYMILGGIIGSMGVVKCKQALLMIGWSLARKNVYSSVALASQVSRLARLMVLNGLILTLKDAADRNKLWQAPYWQINALVAVDLASLTGYLWSPGVELFSLSYALGGASLFFAMITGYNAIFGYASAER